MFTPTPLPATVDSRSVTEAPLAAFTPVAPTRRMSTWLSTALAVPALGATLIPTPLEPTKSEILPFNHKAETYRNKEGLMAFSLRLEQPFLAEEFDKSNFLRVQALDRSCYLIYPPETKFHQKHAEFYGRLRGEGTADHVHHCLRDVGRFLLGAARGPRGPAVRLLAANA